MGIKSLLPTKLNTGIILVIAMFSFQNDMGENYYNCAVLLSLKKILGFSFYYQNLSTEIYLQWKAYTELNIDAKASISQQNEASILLICLTSQYSHMHHPQEPSLKQT